MPEAWGGQRVKSGSSSRFQAVSCHFPHSKAIGHPYWAKFQGSFGGRCSLLPISSLHFCFMACCYRTSSSPKLLFCNWGPRRVPVKQNTVGNPKVCPLLLQALPTDHASSSMVSLTTMMSQQCPVVKKLSHVQCLTCLLSSLQFLYIILYVYFCFFAHLLWEQKKSVHFTP